jgi:cell division protein ZipA
VTIDDLPENADSVVLAPAPPPGERHAVAPAPERRRPRPDASPPPAPADEPPEAAIEPPPEPPAEPAPRQQRIVAIRLVGDRERRIDGTELKRALGAEGLEFGRYAIYHRQVQGGRAVFSVASLVEPGSFEPDTMAEVRYPGVSIFAVYPGPMPAPQAFDDMLATARRLAERLGGTLQDDLGSSLTGQRVLSIREELVHFEHLVALSRSRPGA